MSWVPVTGAVGLYTSGLTTLSMCDGHMKVDLTGPGKKEGEDTGKDTAQSRAVSRERHSQTPGVTLRATVTAQECPGHRNTEQKARIYSRFNLRTLGPLLLLAVTSNGICDRTEATSRRSDSAGAMQVLR